MSPNEFQLRDALHDGEGDTPDAGRLIAHAMGVRRDRRRRLNTALASGAGVVVVAALATTLVVTGNDNTSGSTGGDSSVNGAAMAGGGGAAAPGASASSAAPSTAGSGKVYGSLQAGGAAPSSSPAERCPATPERLMLPGGGGLGQYGSDEALFPDSVTSLRLCGYPLRASAGRTTALVDGAAARSIVDALNSAPTTRVGVKPCPANVNSAAGTLQITGIEADGTATKPVVLTVSCPSSQATNGTAVRYLRDVPETLMQLVIPVPADSPARSLPGKVMVSPVR